MSQSNLLVLMLFQEGLEEVNQFLFSREFMKADEKVGVEKSEDSNNLPYLEQFESSNLILRFFSPVFL